jgi:hypothetical protein
MAACPDHKLNLTEEQEKKNKGYLLPTLKNEMLTCSGAACILLLKRTLC